MAALTLTEKILARASGRPGVAPGDNVWVETDILMTHDVCGPPTIGIFRKEFGKDAKVWDREKVVIIPDHYIFTEDRRARENVGVLRAFAKEQGLPYYYDVGTPDYKGVCHTAMPAEGHVRPGEVIFGTDSHTCTAGAFGAFATGIGNTEAAYILGTGRMWLRVPESMRFVFHGRMPPWLMAKDLILQVIGDIGCDGATYAAMEFDGEAIGGMNVDEQMTLCNMAIEAGGKNGIIAPNKATLDYVKARSKKPANPVYPDKEARYAFSKEYDVGTLDPVVAKPHSPDNKGYAKDLKDIRLDSAYIGSCTGGKVTDFLAVARIVRGKKVAIPTLAVPATVEILEDIKRTTLDGKPVYDILTEAGIKEGAASCMACLGGPLDTLGRIHTRERRISTTNRNFPGRMGSKLGEVYLASPLTVAASALTGRITDPREVL